MAQLDSTHLNGSTPRTVKFLHFEGPIGWNIPFTLGRMNDPEGDHFHLVKKFSVIAKVKQTTRKWRQSLVRKRHTDDSKDNTPSWGVALEDYEDLEHLGGSSKNLCESGHASGSCNKMSKLHPIADNVVFEKHVLESRIHIDSDNEEQEKCCIMMNAIESKRNSVRANGQIEDPTMAETVVAQRNVYQPKEKLPYPKMATKSSGIETSFVKENEEHFSNKKTTSLNVIDEIEEEEPESSENNTEEQEGEKKFPNHWETIKAAMSEKLAPAYATVSEATHRITSKIQGLSPFQATGEEPKWENGASFREFIRSKLEPGDYERPLSEIISELIHPRRTPTEKGALERFKDTLTLLLQTEQPSSPLSTKDLDSSSQISVSTNAYEIEVGEEHQGRILQSSLKDGIFLSVPHPIGST